ncbi:MAG: ribosomal protein S18-alanine N-acetyltransferase [Candidatus Eremiobacteraeota bacterium]|nr:ribosomal protein S18-alanine N-acetyltransferase [Candidatus Eremiobacteraeota bacterium]
MKLDLDPRDAALPGGMAIQTMDDSHLAEITQIETLSFPSTWPHNAFRNEIHDNKLAHYFVGIVGGRAIAYGGIWVILEDSHITTIAVHPDYRGKKYGEIMLLHLLEETIKHGASWITLEVRESNVAAQRLYRKYGFTIVSTRRGYYSDNNENALVMWAGNLKGPLYVNRLQALRKGIPS